MGELLGLGCSAETLWALAQGLTRFGAAQGAPDWLLACVWLCVGDVPYLATVSTEVLPDGFVARPLNIDTPAAFNARIEAELPDIAARLYVRGHGIQAPAAMAIAAPPTSLRDWPAQKYATHVLVRVSQRETRVHRVACALLFTTDSGSSLLVGADPSTMAMVLSDEPELIDRYSLSCEMLTPAEYLNQATS